MRLEATVADAVKTAAISRLTAMTTTQLVRTIRVLCDGSSEWGLE